VSFVSVWNVTYRGWYGTGSPYSLRVVDMLAMFDEIALSRVRCATKALVLTSKLENIYLSRSDPRMNHGSHGYHG
jgi:hypothetical protein